MLRINRRRHKSTIQVRSQVTRDSFIPAREEASRFRGELPLSETAWQDGIAQAIFGVPTRWRRNHALNLERIGHLINDPGAGPMDGLLGDLVLELPVPGLSRDRPISASGIAQLLNCPHAFLLDRLLHFEEPAVAPPQREIGQPDYGLLFHDVAAEFYTANGPAFCAEKRNLAEWLAIAEQIVERQFQDFLKQYPLVGNAVRAQQRERLCRDVRDLLEYDWESLKDTEFTATEKKFGWSVPVELQVGTKRLYVRGRIDRIDVKGQQTIIRDLKTGRAHLRLRNEAGPDPALDIEIAVYGLVAELLAQEWKTPQRIGAAYAYCGRGSAERSFSDDFHEVLKPAATKWLEIAAGLLEARHFPRTPNSQECTYCSFRPVCGEAAYERATALLANAEGALRDFATLKIAESKEN